MELSGYFAVARRWWWTLLVAAWIAGLAGFYVAGRIAPTYESEVRLLVGPINADSETLRSSGQLVQTYAQLVTTPPVISGALTAAGETMPPGLLAANTRVIANDVTRILTIRVQANDPKRAAILANKIADQMIQIVSSGLARPEGAVGIIQEAVPVDDPVAPQVSLIVLLATFAGIVAAIILILLIEYLSTSIRTREELARFARIPVLGSVPAAAKNQPDPKDLIDESSAAATVYRVLAARIVYGDSTEILHSIAIVDTETDTGASVVAVNLSRALARLGRRVVLIDGGDHGGLARLFRVDPVPGIRDVLEREAQPRSALRMVSERLALLPSSTNAGDVVDPDRAKGVIHDLLAYADVVVVATPPVQSGPGALAWARSVEGTVLIARRDHAKREDVAAAAETLLHVGGNLVGAILAERAAPLAGLFGRGRTGSSRTVQATPTRSQTATPPPPAPSSANQASPASPPAAPARIDAYRPPSEMPTAIPPTSAQTPATLRPSIIRASGSTSPTASSTVPAVSSAYQTPAPAHRIIGATAAAPSIPETDWSGNPVAVDSVPEPVAAPPPVVAEPAPTPKRSSSTRSTSTRSRSTTRSSAPRSDPNTTS